MRSSSVNEEPVWHGRSRDVGEPVVTDAILLSQLRHHRKLTRTETVHDQLNLGIGRCPSESDAGRIGEILDETVIAGRIVGIRTFGAAGELIVDRQQAVIGVEIFRHGIWGLWPDVKPL